MIYVLCISCNDPDIALYEELVFPEGSFQVGDFVYLLESDSILEDIPYGQVDTIEIKVTDKLNNPVFRPFSLNGDKNSYYVDSLGYKFFWNLECFEGSQIATISDLIPDSYGILRDSVIFRIEANVVRPTSGWYRSCSQYRADNSNFNEALIFNNGSDTYIVMEDSLLHSDDPISDEWIKKAIPSNISRRYFKISPTGILYASSAKASSTFQVSKDKGDTWEEIKSPGYAHYFIDELEIIYVVGSTDYNGLGSNGIYRSLDMGENWEQVFDFASINSYWTRGGVDAIFSKGRYLYVVKPSYVLKYNNQHNYHLSNFSPSPWGTNASLIHNVAAINDQVFIYEDNSFWHLDLFKENLVKEISAERWIKVLVNDESIFIGNSNGMSLYENGILTDIAPNNPTTFRDLSISNQFIYALGDDGKIHLKFR